MNRIWKAIRANLPLKISAGVLALLIWLYVVLQNEYQINLKVPLVFETKNDSSFVAETALEKEEVGLTVRGKGADILRLRFWGRPTINYILDTDRGWIRVTIGKNNISFPPWSDVSVVSIECKPFLVRVDKMVQRYLTVLPVIEPAVIEARAVPESVKCSGGIEIFKNIKNIYTKPVAVDTTQLPARMKASLDLPPDITCDHTSVILYFGPNTGD
ncbi:hypothetical protein CH333_10025 [candidate division WOR-3 bacterium JGI_Cruoil_03_44_89]|uniref:YbbR-like domain-containing protein n=1 Tax=candidate division WOR-3 bacterium JGI_Cruoil_03_44_89 TaxID=1973748 RepID=A0A235BN79_UNCW3|nr:MAG: hypothetical protein CH333_10025 [candidate division WOR-3 bacterium JGI_Cruoil_03_44_89]